MWVWSSFSSGLTNATFDPSGEIAHPLGIRPGRPGYELDLDRVIEQTRQNACFFEINSSPDRLDLSAANARAALQAGAKIAVPTDVHSTGNSA